MIEYQNYGNSPIRSMLQYHAQVYTSPQIHILSDNAVMPYSLQYYHIIRWCSSTTYLISTSWQIYRMSTFQEKIELAREVAKQRERNITKERLKAKMLAEKITPHLLPKLMEVDVDPRPKASSKRVLTGVPPLMKIKIDPRPHTNGQRTTIPRHLQREKKVITITID